MCKSPMSHRTASRIWIVVCTILLSHPALGQEKPPSPTHESNDSPRLAFTADGKDEYTFDTGVLRGTLRQDGKSRGLSSVVHVPSGTRLDGSMGIVSHYRVFTANKRYGTAAWDWPGTAELRPDGSVQTTWAATPDRPFEMAALYRWKDSQTLDVETTVTAREDLSGFESFLASYFNAAFPSPYVWAHNQDSQTQSSFLQGQKSYGDWLMFTKNADGRTSLIQDGRWRLEPNPVDWTILPRLSAPLCLRRGTTSGLTVILMAPPEDCFAVAMPYAGESHYSLYLSLFGRDLKAGETAKARTRFIVAAAPSDEQLLALYNRYLKDLHQPSAP
jgi:hypothetical protein